MTVAVWWLSSLVALSVAQYSIVCTPSCEWSAGAVMVTSVALPLAVRAGALSTEYLMFATPELLSAGPAGASVAERWTVTSLLCQFASALSLELGAAVSILTVADLYGLSTLPALSVPQ